MTGSRDTIPVLHILGKIPFSSKINASPPPIGITLVLFDGEDMGRSGTPKSYAQGSLAFAKDLPIEKPDEAIILDMIGDAELHIPIERYSYQQNRQLVKKLWGLAKVLSLDAFTMITSRCGLKQKYQQLTLSILITQIVIRIIGTQPRTCLSIALPKVWGKLAPY